MWARRFRSPPRTFAARDDGASGIRRPPEASIARATSRIAVVFSGAVSTASTRRLPLAGVVNVPAAGSATSVFQPRRCPSPHGRTGSTRPGAGRVVRRATGFVGSGGDWQNASIVSATARACASPAFAASLAVTPISRTGRPSSDADAANPAVVRFHKTRRTGRPTP